MKRKTPAPADQQLIDGQSAVNPQVILTPPPFGSRAAAIRRDATRFPNIKPSALARRVGCSRQHASRVLADFLTPHTDDELRQFQENKADILDSKAYQIVESMTPEKIAKTSLSALAVSFGILYDKAALVRGQATGINLTVLMDVASMIRRDD